VPARRRPSVPPGQALVEYIWIIAVVALVTIPAMMFTREAMGTLFIRQQQALTAPAFPTLTPGPTATPTVSPYRVPTDAAQCKNGGWQYFVTPDGTFKNQGDCVSWVQTNGKNAPANP